MKHLLNKHFDLIFTAFMIITSIAAIINIAMFIMRVFLPLPAEAKIIIRLKTHKTEAKKVTPGVTATPTPGRFVSDALADPKLNDEEWRIISKYPHRQVIAHIYKHESSFGRFDVCRSRGKANGFGFAEWTGHSPTCYDSFETVVKLVNDWVQDKLDRGMSYNAINCLYVRGLHTESCDTAYKLQSKL